VPSPGIRKSNGGFLSYAITEFNSGRLDLAIYTNEVALPRNPSGRKASERDGNDNTNLVAYEINSDF
jgi:hypothetical protein